MFSPDGRWLAYTSNESGRDEVYVQAFPGPGGKRQVSIEGGTEPVWARNGRQLFYRQEDTIMAVDVSGGPDFAPGQPRLRLVATGRFTRGHRDHPNYDVAPDGQRLLVLLADDVSPSASVHVVINWLEELRRRAPVRKDGS